MEKEDVANEISVQGKSNADVLNSVKENIKRFVNNIELIAKKGLVFASAFSAIYFVINLGSNYLYQINCERYYKIPAIYFSKKIDFDLIFIGLVMLLLFISFIPVLIQRYSVKCETDTNGKLVYMIFLEVIVGMTVGVMNISYLDSIFHNSNIPDWIKSIYSFIIFPYNEYTAVFITISLYVVCTVLILLKPKFDNSKRKYVKKIYIGFLSILVILNLSIVIIGIYSKVDSPIKDKTSYEIINIQNDKYVVLSEYDDKSLCVTYEAKKEQGQERFTLYTDSYYFFSREEGIYSYIHMEEPPTIEKERKFNN